MTACTDGEHAKGVLWVKQIHFCENGLTKNMNSSAMKTTIWTAYNFSKPPLSKEEESRCIFRGDTLFQLRAGDQIQVLDGFCVEKVEYVYYSIPHSSQEVHLTTCDAGKEYPTVSIE